MYTQKQNALLSKNTQFQVLDELPDGDLLVIDQINKPSGLFIRTHAEDRLYILTRIGYIQDVNYHYRYFHGKNIHAFHADRAQPSVDGANYIYESG